MLALDVHCSAAEQDNKLFPWLAWVKETVLFIETVPMITGYTSQLPNITNEMSEEKKKTHA